MAQAVNTKRRHIDHREERDGRRGAKGRNAERKGGQANRTRGWGEKGQQASRVSAKQRRHTGPVTCSGKEREKKDVIHD
jgi:hypothetical protein